MKKVLTLLLLSGYVAVNAQTADSVSMGASYANKVFYSFSGSTVGAMANNNWDLAIAVYSVQTASVRVNGGFGAVLYQYDGGDTTVWATLDTTGLTAGTNWKRCVDSDTSYEPSAFEYFATGHPDYGWGTYNSVTHDVNGHKLFVMTTSSGAYKKVWIKNQKAVGNNMTIRVANLDNSNDTTITFSKTASSKNYIYLNLSTSVITDSEISNSTYDIIFTKYEATLAPGVYYPVTGVLLNRNVKAAELRNTDIDDALSTPYSLGENMSEIGSDWKEFNMNTFQYDIVDSLSYFVEDLQGDVWQLWFTGFQGSSTGKIWFNKRQVGWASVEDNNQVVGNFNVYPNPVADYVNVTYTMNNAYTEGTVSMYDLSGKNVYQKNIGNNFGFNNHVIDVRSLGLTPGVYMLRMQIGNNQSVQKLIIR